MVKRSQLVCALALILLFVPFATGEAHQKIQVKDQSDLPRFTYPLPGPASVLLQADAATFNAFAAKVRTDLDAILRDYEIEDKATLRSLLSAKLDLQHLAGEDAAALETVKALARAGGETVSASDHRALYAVCAGKRDRDEQPQPSRF
jgi:hypothetical protein